MSRFFVTKFVAPACILIFVNAFFQWTGLEESVLAREPAEILILAVNEIKDEGDKGPVKISLDEVDEARQLTGERIYGLMIFWVFILLAVFLLRYQSRDDEKLYDEGYYNS